MTEAEGDYVVAVLLDELRVRTRVAVDGVTEDLNRLLVEEFLSWCATEANDAVDAARQPDGTLSPFVLARRLTPSVLRFYSSRFGDPPTEGVF